MTMIRRTVDLLTPERCCLSFNGGKDSTALLHLIKAAVPDGWQRIRFV
jgi:tRNA(Ile)-lysidine synthase TilS/MesJ